MLTFIQEETTCISGSFYYQSDLAGAHIDQAVFLDLIKEKLPQVYVKFQSLEFPLQPLTINWFLCLYIHAVPLETTLRIWDVMFYEGSKILFRVALSLLKINESTIMAATRMDDLMQFIKDVPRTTQDASYVMKCCFDPLWIGSFPQSRIDQLRKRHQEDVIRRMSKTRDERAAMAAQSKLRREAAALKLAAAANEAAKQAPAAEEVGVAADAAANQDAQSSKTNEVGQQFSFVHGKIFRMLFQVLSTFFFIVLFVIFVGRSMWLPKSMIESHNSKSCLGTHDRR